MGLAQLLKANMIGWVSGFGMFLLAGCYSPQIQYDWGWGTQRIVGTVSDDAGKPLLQKGFILVRSYYSQFVELQEGKPLYFPQTRLFFPDEEGRFIIPFDLAAVKMDLNFFVSGYVMQSISFQRQMGVGNISYQVRMKRTAGWQDHLFVTIIPFLQQFILEQDFQMAQAHQLYLGEWLSQEKAKYTIERNSGTKQ